jgi:predicted 2-oxoglutarate/Fe(II)-dependent dioxygenase YbiX
MDAHESSFDLPALATRYRDQDFAHLPEFISTARAAELLAATTDVTVKRVRCRDENVQFGEQNFDDEHPISRFFAADQLTRLALALTGSQQLRRIQSWTLVYRVGEYIDPHTDAAGTIQVIVCLQAPAAHSNGGQLVLRPNTADEVRLGLGAGDALVFAASSVQHCTTPLTGSLTDPDPMRVVAVGRYYTS